MPLSAVLLLGVALTISVESAQGFLLRESEKAMAATTGSCSSFRCTECPSIILEPSAWTPNFANFQAMKLFAEVKKKSVDCKDESCDGDEYKCVERVEWGPYDATCERDGMPHASGWQVVLPHSEEAVAAMCKSCACTWSAAVPFSKATRHSRRHELLMDCKAKCDRSASGSFFTQFTEPKDCYNGCTAAEEDEKKASEVKEAERAGYFLFGTALPRVHVAAWSAQNHALTLKRSSVLRSDCQGKCASWYSSRHGSSAAKDGYIAACKYGCTMAGGNAKAGCEEFSDAAQKLGCEFYGTDLPVFVRN